MSLARKKKHDGRKYPRLRYDRADRKLIRFRSQRLGRIVNTRIFDISASGIAFLVANKFAPRIGEMINMDFAPTGSIQIACTGRVIRVEEPQERAEWQHFADTVKVGVHFHQMPDVYRVMLYEALGELLNDFSENTPSERVTTAAVLKAFDFSSESKWFRDNLWSFLAAIAIVVVAVWGIYTVSENSEQSKAHVDAPWASGFFEKVINKDK